MKFRTEISIPKFDKVIEHHESILAIGSCFTENIGAYFEKYKFRILKNPFGVIYNPVSIFNSLNLAVSKKRFEKDELIYDQREYHSFYHHSDFSHHDPEQCLEMINTGITETNNFLKSTDWIIISLGTAYVFKYKKNGVIVSNCHKIPGNQFERFRLSIDETKEYLGKLISLNKKINPDLKIVFTVSPVRHWRDGAHQNQLSKSTLLLAVEEMISLHKNVFYFPSYELLLDDLRDYRYYGKDLLHPNEAATEYIWMKVKESLLSDNCNQIIDKLDKILSAASHRIRNPGSEKNITFIKNNLALIEEIAEQYPHIILEREKKHFNQYIKEVK